MTTALPPYAPRELVERRLPLIFPDGSPESEFCTNEAAIRTVFTALYIGAIEGTARYLAPKHVYRMSIAQAEATSDAQRLNYMTEALRAGSKPLDQSWYADTSREPVRDEAIRQGFIPNGAVLKRTDVAPSYPKGHYALARDFAALFDPALSGKQLAGAIEAWQATHFSVSARTRITLVRRGATIDPNGVPVTFPNGAIRVLSAGVSSIISKGVIEHFAPRFLVEPVALWLSESGNKVVISEDLTAKAIGLNIEPSRTLPDIILVDLRDPVLLVFVEVVATDGPISAQRREELMAIATAGGFPEDRVTFLTAFEDRNKGPARKLMSKLAWNTFAWFASEPENIVAMYESDGSQPRLHELMRRSVKR